MTPLNVEQIRFEVPSLDDKIQEFHKLLEQCTGDVIILKTNSIFASILMLAAKSIYVPAGSDEWVEASSPNYTYVGTYTANQKIVKVFTKQE